MKNVGELIFKKEVGEMSSEQIIEMSDYYKEKYGQPRTDNEAINKLLQVYKDLFDVVPNKEVKEGLAEYYRILQNRDLPAYLWILESLHVTSKKGEDKRNFSYCVGILRQWMKYGFGHIPNQVEDELADYFSELFGTELEGEGRLILQNLMGSYSVVKVTKEIGTIPNLTQSEMACAVMKYLQSRMKRKYGEHSKSL